MRPQWEGGWWRKEGGGGDGGAGESSCNTSQRAFSTPAYPSASLHIFISHAHLFISPAPPPPPLPPSLFFPSPLFSSLPPFSLLMPDTAHDLSFVYQQTFKGKMAQTLPKKYVAQIRCCATCLPILFSPT